MTPGFLANNIKIFLAFIGSEFKTVGPATKKHGSQRCRDELVELTVDDVWQIADAGDQELQRLARNNRRGNLEFGVEDNDGLSQRACTALAGE